jgi:hypothetical protein
MLVRLASHYHRPDFGPAQVKYMVLDFIEDLADYTLAEIETAIREYRRDTENRFFPRTADILEICHENRKHRAHVLGCDHVSREPEFGESRPIRWWSQRRSFWKPHWREAEVPAGEKCRDAISNDFREPVRA